ncbi:MAG: RNA polymerase sigma factor [Actinomycetota bacterium]
MDPRERKPSHTGPAAFSEFFEASHVSLFRAMYLLTGNRQEAEELMQEAFVRVLERWERVVRMESPEGYLYRIALNLHRNRQRRARLVVRRLTAPSAGVDEFDRADERDALARALAKLPPRQRAAVVLTEVLDYSSEQAGEMLGIRASTVRALAYQGRNALRESLGGHDG